MPVAFSPQRGLPLTMVPDTWKAGAVFIYKLGASFCSGRPCLSFLSV